MTRTHGSLTILTGFQVTGQAPEGEISERILIRVQRTRPDGQRTRDLKGEEYKHMRIVSGKFRGKKIISPIHEGTRPTSDRTREMIFNILLHNPAFGSKVLVDKRVLDVFAGTGALGLEAYSRGAESVTFIEKDRETLSILRVNVKAFDLPHMCILEQDATALRQKPSSSFDLIFLDPPYHQDLVLSTLTQLMTHGWLSQDAVIIVETAKNEFPPLPPFLSLILERTSGAAKVYFLKWEK